LAESDGKRRILEYNSGSKQQRKTLPKQRFKFPKGACCITIGRSSSNKLVIDDSKLSREHCKIESTDGITYVFVDLGSSRGSKINKIQVTRCELHNGDSIKIGSTKMRFRGMQLPIHAVACILTRTIYSGCRKEKRVFQLEHFYCTL
jgi:pSer/pThr/pTyr-binding forkhead associated (FHA) protein